MSPFAKFLALYFAIGAVTGLKIMGDPEVDHYMDMQIAGFVWGLFLWPVEFLSWVLWAIKRVKTNFSDKDAEVSSEPPVS